MLEIGDGNIKPKDMRVLVVLVEVGYAFSSYHHQQHRASGIMTYSCRKVESGAEVQDRKDSMVIGYYLLTW